MTFTGKPRPTPAAGTGGLRQFQADFANGALRGLDATARPDALVLPPRIAYALGPRALGDLTDGPIAWAWRVRVSDAGQVLIARENDARTAWGAETVVFTITAPLPTEIDLAFEQSGNVSVCAQRPTGAGDTPEVWLYYLNPLLLGFVFQSFGPGRTPRLVLDNPATPSESDVLLVYLNPVADRLELRQQRDRFAVVFPGPVSPVTDVFLEEVAITIDNRIRCVFSRRNPVTGTYSIELLDSTLYPFVLASEDGARAGHPAITGGDVRRTLLSYGPEPFGRPSISEDGLVPAEGATPGHPATLPTSTLGGNEIIITGTGNPRLPPEDGARPQHPAALPSTTLRDPIITIIGTGNPQLRPEDGTRPGAPEVLPSSLLGASLIAVTGTGSPRLQPEDAARPAAPTVLPTSTLV